MEWLKGSGTSQTGHFLKKKKIRRKNPCWCQPNQSCKHRSIKLLKLFWIKSWTQLSQSLELLQSNNSLIFTVSLKQFLEATPHPPCSSSLQLCIRPHAAGMMWTEMSDHWTQQELICCQFSQIIVPKREHVHAKVHLLWVPVAYFIITRSFWEPEVLIY